MREQLEKMSLAQLKELAKSEGIKNLSTMRKPQIIDALMEIFNKRQEEKKQEFLKQKQESEESVENKEDKGVGVKSEVEAVEESVAEESQDEDISAADLSDEAEEKNRKSNVPDDLKDAYGILEIVPEQGYGFMRGMDYMPGPDDVYVSPFFIRKLRLKTGDIIKGKKKPTNKFDSIYTVETINGFENTPEFVASRKNFEDLTPIFPNHRIKLVDDRADKQDLSMRIMDLFSPIGKGQRGMLVSPPKAGKTTLLKKIASAIQRSEKDMHIIILLIDERPEEVTDIKESVVGDEVEVIHSTFDQVPENHKRMAEFAIERAKRLVEQGRDVTILLDSITRLARAYNLIVPPSGKTLSGGLDPTSLNAPKRFFGAARNMREGGSLTILATALVDTGSKMDDVVFEEFKGTGNMELVLDRRLSERRIYPAIDIAKSGTRNERLLLTTEEADTMDMLRKALTSDVEEATRNILDQFSHTQNNRIFLDLIRKRRLI